jgi:MATE family multidrug resistance protein
VTGAPGAATPAPAPRPGLGVLLGLAWPIVVSRSSQVVVGVADAVMVAHLGASALAATTAGAMNAFALFILPMGVVFIVSSFSSQLFGMGDAPGARRYGWYGLIVAALTQVAGVAAIPAAGWALGRLDLPRDVQALMVDYLAIRLWSGGAAIGLEALGNYYGGLGDTRRPMVASVAAMVLNVAGNWLLIDGRLGRPRWRAPSPSPGCWRASSWTAGAPRPGGASRSTSSAGCSASACPPASTGSSSSSPSTSS